MSSVITISDVERQIRIARGFRDDFPDAWTPADADDLSDLENQLIDLRTSA